jgi:hypothetical protein
MRRLEQQIPTAAAGQTRNGDGSACSGGGKPNCDLGYCSGHTNNFARC